MRPPLAEGGSRIWPPWLANDECLSRVEPEDMFADREPEKVGLVVTCSKRFERFYELYPH